MSSMEPGTTVYRVFHVSFNSGPELHLQIGTVAPCGEWVDVGYARYPSGGWYLRRCDAEAAMAADIARHGQRCLDYSYELRARAAS